MLRTLDLFSGIGGFSLGLERTGGFRTVAFCEIEAFPKKVLAKHWPGVPIYDDVRTLSATQLAADGISVDVICGGFPCQDISLAGKGDGLDGTRSGLWKEFARLIGELRPRYVILENTPALLSRGLGRILGELVSLGFDTEWNCIPASALGAPHRRDRFWLVAYPGGDPLRLVEQRLSWGWSAGISAEGQAEPENDGEEGPLADADGPEWGTFVRACGRVAGQEPLLQGHEGAGSLGTGREALANTDSGGWEILGLTQHAVEQRASGDQPDRRGAPGLRHGADVADADRARLEVEFDSDQAELTPSVGAGGGGALPGLGRMVDGPATGLDGDLRWPHEKEGLGIWEVEPDIPRVAPGVKNRVARLKALGNSLVPQIPEMIGRAILAHEKGPPERA